MGGKNWFVNIVTILVLVALLAGFAWTPHNAPVVEAREIDRPGETEIYNESVSLLSVIVKGKSLTEIEELVLAYDGHITSRLSIINSVVADLSPHAVEALKNHPDVLGVWLNRSVDVASTIPEGGTLLWTSSTSSSIESRPAMGVNGTIYVADRNRKLYAFAADGSLLWTYRTIGFLRASPIVGPDNTIYIGDTIGRFYAIDADGELSWHYQLNRPIFQTAALTDDGMLAIAATEKLYILDTTGDMVDSYNPRRLISTDPAVSQDGNVVYFGDTSGNLYAYEIDGSLLWKEDTGRWFVEYAPVVAQDGTIYSVANDMITATDADGDELWDYETDWPIIVKPKPGKDGQVYVGDRKGTLYELDQNGDLLNKVSSGFPIIVDMTIAADGSTFMARKKRLTVRDVEGQDLFNYKTTGKIKAGFTLGANDSVLFLTDNKKNLYLIYTGVMETGDAHDTAYPRVAGAENVWAAGVTGDGIGVAIVDTGIAPLDGLVQDVNGDSRLVGWVDMIDGSTEPIDPNGHGTHVAGIVANSDLTEIGHYAGVAPNVNLVGVRVLDEFGSGTYAEVISGIDWVVQNKEEYNIRVMNLSLVTLPQSHYWEDPLNQAVMAAWAADIVVVVSAGNSGPAPMSVGVPANVPYVITVGAFTDNYTPDDHTDDYVAPFSSAGPTWDGFVKPDVVAPGAHMASIMPSDSYLAGLYPDRQVAENYFQWAGTSTAAPVVSAICAMVLEQNPDLTADQVKYRVLSSAKLAVQDQDGDGTMDALAVSPWRQGTGHVWASDAVLSDSTQYANGNMNISFDLAGEEHYIGPTRYHQETNSYYVEGDGEYVWDGSEYVWDGGEYVWDGGEYVWDGGEYVWDGGEYVWDGGEYVWDGGEYVWDGGEYVWSGSEYVWNGGEYVWSGSEYVWSGSEYVWSGSEYVWSGSEYVWSGSEYVWSGGEYVWSGGEYVWDGGEYVWNGSEYVWNGGEYVWDGGEYVWDGGEYVWDGGLDQVLMVLGTLPEY
jgi:serine protease AprX